MAIAYTEDECHYGFKAHLLMDSLGIVGEQPICRYQFKLSRKLPDWREEIRSLLTGSKGHISACQQK